MLTVQNAGRSNSGIYSVIVSNPWEATSSSRALLNVQVPQTADTHARFYRVVEKDALPR